MPHKIHHLARVEKYTLPLKHEMVIRYHKKSSSKYVKADVLKVWASHHVWSTKK